MEYSFNAKTFRTLLHSAVARHIESLIADTAAEESPEQLLAGTEKAIDVKECADADAAARHGEAVLSAAEITEIGHFPPGGPHIPLDCKAGRPYQQARAGG
jgi:hypothetical protein